MGRSPSSNDNVLKKGPWTEEEDQILLNYIHQHGGHGRWRLLPKRAGLNRCGKSCRLRWTNYLRPDIKRGNFSHEEEETIINLHVAIGNKWSQIAAHLPGRTDNEIKNYWNTNIKRKLTKCGIDPKTHHPMYDLNFLVNLSHLISLSTSNLTNMMSPMFYATNTQLFLNLSQFTNTANYSLPKIEETSLSQCHGLMNGTRGPLYAMNDIYQEPSNMAISSQIDGDNLVVEGSATRCEARVNHDKMFLDLVPTISENAVIKEMLKESYPTYIPTDSKRTTYNTFETFKELMDDFEDDVSFWKDLLN